MSKSDSASNITKGTVRRHFMIAEDDPDDQMLIEDALVENGVAKETIHFVDDGESLLNALNNTNNVPDIILLDLNMPRVDGRQALKKIKSDNKLKHIPIVIFTTSSSLEDVKSSYQDGCNTFFTKPSSFNDLVESMGIIKTYWAERAILAGAN